MALLGRDLCPAVDDYELMMMIIGFDLLSVFGYINRQTLLIDLVDIPT